MEEVWLGRKAGGSSGCSPAPPPSSRPSPMEPTVWALPRPEVRLGTVHFWKSCWKTADSAPSFCTSTCVLGGYFLALIKFWEEKGVAGAMSHPWPLPAAPSASQSLLQPDQTRPYT